MKWPTFLLFSVRRKQGEGEEGEERESCRRIISKGRQKEKKNTPTKKHTNKTPKTLQKVGGQIAMTQFKGRARTRPTNSQHLPTHSKERKQQDRNKLSAHSTSSCYELIPPGQSLCKEHSITKDSTSLINPFTCVREGQSSRRHPGRGGANQGQVLKIKVKRAQPVRTSWGSLTSEGWEPHQEMAELSPCKGPTSGITCANVEEITQPDGMIWHGSSSFHTGLSWHIQEILICCGFHHLLWQLMALNRLPRRQAQEVPIF